MVVLNQDGKRTSRLFVSVRKLSEYLLSMYNEPECHTSYLRYVLHHYKTYILLQSSRTKITLEKVVLHL